MGWQCLSIIPSLEACSRPPNARRKKFTPHHQLERRANMLGCTDSDDMGCPLLDPLPPNNSRGQDSGLLALPTEIISEIFTRFLPVYPLCPPLTGLLSPTLLTYICREFREIALDTPMLWRGISFCDDGSLAQQLHLTDLWLGRSRFCPLSIQIEEIDSSAAVYQFIAAVLPHRARWEYLHLRLMSWRILLAVDGPMPLLRQLHLTLNDDSDPVTVAFLELPLLRSVTLSEYATSNITLPWVQLTSLTLKCVYRSEYLPILQQASNLGQCELVDILFEYHDDPNPQEIMLPCMGSLTMDQSRDDWVDRKYPDVFIVPALQRLRIQESFLGPSPIEALASFLSKSGSKPREVCITGKRSIRSASYRSAFPSIPEFSFTGPFVSRETAVEEVDGDLHP
ncbi:hypothetical protein MVEN_02286700 [Mycena venus]|uniref:F-box domain-containing protein n=1 Tax=Mycena venus TaxID=2733690 RepID=A0A8H6X579_9AGAR|nr:hypothetical protein MVEN_02286700 [Mycena venus]